MPNLTEDIRSDLTKIFSQKETVNEEHIPSSEIYEYAEEIKTYLKDMANSNNLSNEYAKELGNKMDKILAFIDKNLYSSYLDR